MTRIAYTTDGELADEDRVTILNCAGRQIGIACYGYINYI